MDAGEDMTKVSDWSSARILRRIAALRAENRGRHEFFHGPKHMAFRRVLRQARRSGRVIVVVLPLPKAYTEAFLDEKTVTAFEMALTEATAIAPEATLIRLDRVPGISDHGNFGDLVHMNSFGRRVATQEFLRAVNKSTTAELGSPVCCVHK
jgi:hypothetical protein